MAVTSQQIVDFLLANPGMSDAQIAAAMQEFNVTPAMMAAAVNVPVEAVQERYIAAAPNTETAENINKLASQILAQGTTEAWTGGLPPETAALYMASDLAKSGVTNIEQITKSDTGIVNAMTGEKLVSGYGERTGGNLWSGSYEGKGNTGFGVNFDESGKPIFYTQGASSSTLKNDVLKLAAVVAAVYGIPGVSEGLLSGAAGGAATLGTTGLTAAELAAYDLALGGAGGTAGATSLAGALTTGAAVPTLTNLTGGSGVGTLGVTGANGAFLGEGVLSGVPTFDAALANATVGATGLTAAGTLPTTTTGLFNSTAVTPTAVTPTAVTPTAVTPTAVTPTAVPPTGVPPTGVPPIGVPPVGVPPITVPTVADITRLAQTGLTAAQIAALLSTGTQTAAGLLQQQTSREAAIKAQGMIDAETAAAKTSAAFRPIGMTTRFGTSQFAIDPKTGQLTSAGYTLSPEAKNAQDRFLTLAGAGLTQAEGAQKAFEPLQTGAQSLFKLGAGYLAEKPETVAQNYLNQQMALLKPGRELELASLQNRLQQQGRGGLSVSQGGTLGATTPELQALYNARAQQEAQLAANAQQYGQQQVSFGAGLLGQGSQAMGQYYGGQQAAYAPFTSAFGQMQALESAAQQPFQLGVGLGKETSTAGYNVGRLGLTGAGQSVALATGADATRNPYASALSGAAANPMFGQVVGGLLGGTPATSGFSYGQYGTGIDPSTGEYFGSLYF